MRYFPIFLDLAGRSVLLAGGGEEMARKARLVGRSAARLVVMAETLGEELAQAVAAGRAVHVPRTFDEAAIDRAALVFASTGCVGIDALVAARARAAGVPVNVVDRPRLCTFLTPALVDRDPLVIAIGTEGTAPVLAREVREGLEAGLSPGLGGLAALAGSLRATVEDAVPKESRRSFWEWVFRGAPRRLWDGGAEEAARAAVLAAARSGGPRREGRASVLLVPRDRERLTLRALRRLQDADLILTAPGTEGVVELARRDSARVAAADPAGALAEGLARGLAAVALLPEAAEAEARALAAATGAELVGPGAAEPAGQLAGMM